jgi:hypothetical protein
MAEKFRYGPNADFPFRSRPHRPFCVEWCLRRMMAKPFRQNPGSDCLQQLDQ